MTKKKSKFIHIIFAAVFFAAFFVCLLLSLSRAQESGGIIAVIYLNGQEFQRFQTETDQRIDVAGLCFVVCEDGSVHIENSVCPDHLCESAGILSSQPLVCLPERIMVCYLDETDADFDAVVK